MLTIMSRCSFEDFIKTAVGVCTVVSINDPGIDPPSGLYNPCVVDSLILHFDDVEDSILEKGDLVHFNTEHALQILEFSQKHADMAKSDSNQFITHCHGGVSRSAAVVAALHLILGVDDDWYIWRNGQLCPNHEVYETLLKVANVAQLSIVKDSKYNVNNWAFKEIHID